MFSSSRRDRVTSAPVAYSQSSGRLLAMHRPQAGLLPSHFYKELVNKGCFPSDDDQGIHTALSLRHGKQAAPLFRGRLAEEDEEDMSEMSVEVSGMYDLFVWTVRWTHRVQHLSLIYQTGTQDIRRRERIYHQYTQRSLNCGLYGCRHGTYGTGFDSSSGRFMSASSRAG